MQNYFRVYKKKTQFKAVTSRPFGLITYIEQILFCPERFPLSYTIRNIFIMEIYKLKATSKGAIHIILTIFYNMPSAMCLMDRFENNFQPPMMSY